MEEIENDEIQIQNDSILSVMSLGSIQNLIDVGSDESFMQPCSSKTVWSSTPATKKPLLDGSCSSQKLNEEEDVLNSTYTVKETNETQKTSSKHISEEPSTSSKLRKKTTTKKTKMPRMNAAANARLQMASPVPTSSASSRKPAYNLRGTTTDKTKASIARNGPITKKPSLPIRSQNKKSTNIPKNTIPVPSAATSISRRTSLLPPPSTGLKKKAEGKKIDSVTSSASFKPESSIKSLTSSTRLQEPKKVVLEKKKKSTSNQFSNLKDLETENEDLKLKLIQINNESESSKKKLKVKYLKDLKEKEEIWKKEIDEVTSTNEELKQELEELKSKLDKQVEEKLLILIEPYQKSYDDLKSTQSMIELKNDQIHKLQKQNELYKVEVIKLQHAMNQLKVKEHENEEQKLVLKNKSSEITRLELELLAAQSTCSEQEKENLKLKQDIEELNFKNSSFSTHDDKNPFNPVFETSITEV